MSSRDLQSNDEDEVDPASTQVQFALVIARMLETVKTHPEHMRQVVYDLARDKLQEQFTHADVKEMNRSKQALEAAIRSVEEFSQQDISLPPPTAPAPPALKAPNEVLPPRQLGDQELPPARPRPRIEIDRSPARDGHPLWPVIRRTAVLLLFAGLAVLAVQHRARLTSLADYLASQIQERQIAAPPPPTPVLPPAAPPADPPKPNPLRPTDYGVYAVVDDKSLAELQLLPGRPPDIRVAVSAAFQVPDQASLPNGRLKFIVFRRDAANNFLERAEVRVVAKITREFSAEATAGKPGENDGSAVIRSFSYPFRVAPVPDNPETYELHSDDPALELPPGRYALILKTQAYYFRVAGGITDPRQCIERITATNGTFYTDCKKP